MTAYTATSYTGTSYTTTDYAGTDYTTADSAASKAASKSAASVGALARGSSLADISNVRSVAAAITSSVERAIEGKHHVIALALAVLLSGGHLLIEDVPGVGKTTLAKALARSIDGDIQRIQFTPDLLPSDVIGVSIYNSDNRSFEFKPGAVFSHVLVADEINRASPKTQSALLECMQERQVTNDGVTYPLQTPFMVIATQNPIDMEGTYPLPEAQRDRFSACIAMGYPDTKAELAMLDEHCADDPVAAMPTVSSPAEIAALIQMVANVYVSPAVKQYVVNVLGATRATPELRLGASPRAGLHLLRTGRAVAALDGRDFVLPDDIAALAVPVLAHRLLLNAQTRADGSSTTDVVKQLIKHTPVPTAGQ